MLAHVDYLLCNFNVLTGEGLVSTHSDEFLDRPFELGGHIVEDVTFRMAKGVVEFLDKQIIEPRDSIGEYGTQDRRDFVWWIFDWFVRDYDNISEWDKVKQSSLAIVIDWYVESRADAIKVGGAE